MLAGYEPHVSRARRIEVEETNFLPIAGVRPGRNTIEFQLEEFGARAVAGVRVLGDTGLYHTRAGPPVLRLGVRSPDGKVGVGGRARLADDLSLVSGWSPEGVGITAAGRGGCARLDAGARRFARIGHRRVGGTLVLRAVRAGSCLVVVNLTNSWSQAEARVRLRIGTRP
jgi:hypothetical protein